MQGVGQSDQRLWLGQQFLDILRRAVRRDISVAGEFFAVPQGQIAYVLAGFQKQAIDVVCKVGLPYHVHGLSRMLEGSYATRLEDVAAPDLAGMPEWRREAVEFSVDHFWLLQSWLKADLGVGAMLGGLRKRHEAEILAEMHPRLLKKLAWAMHGHFHLNSAMAMQMALIFADAQASQDRVLIARSGCKLMAAA